MKGSTASKERQRGSDSPGDRMMMTTMTVQSLLLLLLLLLACLCIESSVGGKTTTIVRHTDTTQPHLDGFWTNRTTWNARWVKYWRAKRIYEPVWKKVWTPTILNEWVPLPNAPQPDAWQKPEQQHLHSSED